MANLGSGQDRPIRTNQHHMARMESNQRPGGTDNAMYLGKPRINPRKHDKKAVGRMSMTLTTTKVMAISAREQQSRKCLLTFVVMSFAAPKQSLIETNAVCSFTAVRQNGLPGRSSEHLCYLSAYSPPSLRFGAAVFALRCAPCEEAVPREFPTGRCMFNMPMAGQCRNILTQRRKSGRAIPPSRRLHLHRLKADRLPPAYALCSWNSFWATILYRGVPNTQPPRILSPNLRRNDRGEIKPPHGDF